MTAAPALRAKGLTCRLGGREVIRGVDLDVQEAEVVGLFGPNGAGKTTLMRLLIGALDPDAGAIHLGEHRIDRLPTYRRSRLGLGYLPQESSVFRGLNVRQNIEAVLQVRGRGLDAADALMEIFELESLAKRRAATLSGGERRRLELARLLAINPRAVLLDEPLAGLDPLAIDALKRQILTLSQRGVAVLIADHNVQQSLTICQRVCILVDGRIIVSGPAAEVVDHDEARRAFFGSGFKSADPRPPSGDLGNIQP